MKEERIFLHIGDIIYIANYDIHQGRITLEEALSQKWSGPYLHTHTQNQREIFEFITSLESLWL